MKYNFVEMENFGKWLRQKRKDLGLYQKDVAERAGVSVSYISTLERSQPHSLTDKNIRPEPNVVESIAKAVNGNVIEALKYFGYHPKMEGKTKTFQIDDYIELVFYPNEELTPEDFADLAESLRALAKGKRALKKERMEAETKQTGPPPRGNATPFRSSAKVTPVPDPEKEPVHN